MMWLFNSTIARLRDQLQLHGQRPSIAAPEPNLSPDAVLAEYGPLCEAMYLIAKCPNG